MNETETRAEHIDPALKAAGWGVVEGSRILREYRITLGRLEGLGRRAKEVKADYILVYRNHKLAVIEANAWRDRFAAVPFEDRGGYFQARYYQDLAIERVMESIAADKSRILLTLATGTGKTFIAFQIAWKLFHSRWNLSREPSRRPRILFLADRNI